MLGCVLGDCRPAGRKCEVADTPPSRMNSVGDGARVFGLGAGGEDEEDRGRGDHSLYTNKYVSRSAAGERERTLS